MKYKLILSALIFFSVHAFAQDLTGIWRGNFYAGIGPYQEYYKYEVQINQLKNYSLQGVTYSYRTTVFYGKATFAGIWFPKTHSMLLKELKLVELKIAGNSEACAMTCDLEYSKEDNKQILKGTFTSVKTDTKRDCGAGTVYLEKVLQSDFHKEDFLIKKPVTPPPAIQNNIKPKPSPPVVNDMSKLNAKKIQAALGIPADGVIGPKTTAAIKKKVPDFNSKIDLNNTVQVNKLIDQIKKSNATLAIKKSLPNNSSPQSKVQSPVVIRKDTIAKILPPSNQNQIVNPPLKKMLPVPEVIKTRSNNLVRTINTNLPDIKVELYDNGDIDGDTITVYDNNQPIAWKKGLTDKPLTLTIKADPNNLVHEFVMVADNLGRIPPNTALMIITTGGKRYELFISSDKQKNAKVIVQYNPASTNQ